jgi:hypothetical protein
MTLNKTEQAIVAHMRRRTGRYSAATAVGRGAEGGRINEGHRAFAACKSLVAKGVAEQVGDIYFHTIVQRGYGVACAEIVIKLKETANA